MFFKNAILVLIATLLVAVSLLAQVPVFILVIFVVLAGLLLLAHLFKEAEKKKDKMKGQVSPVTDDFPPILDKSGIPDFYTASPKQVLDAVREATGNTFRHRPYEIVGQPALGLINGLMKVWDAFGKTKEFVFSNERGYRVFVRFIESGKIEPLYCQWACFNPLYSVSHSEFKGTFRPIGSYGILDATENIPEISKEKSAELSHLIFPFPQETTVKSDEPQKTEGSDEETQKTEPSEKDQKDVSIILDELTVGAGPNRMTFKGVIPVTKNNKEILMEIIKAGSEIKSVSEIKDQKK